MQLPVDKRKLHDLETAALRAIAHDCIDVAPQLLDLFKSCTVTHSEKTGSGFFTALTLDTAAFSPVSLRSPIGDAWLDIDGMQVGICCLVFFTEGYPTLLEGYAVAGEDTSEIDFGSVRFRVRSEPPTGGR
jgi:hypothetical protein